MFSRLLFECFAEAGRPDGVANFVTRSGSEVRATLTEYDAVDAVSFTDSTAVGTSVAQSVADDLKRVQCEMGGKNPTAVMPSADIGEATEAVGVGEFGTTGQSCTACSRAIVHEDIYYEFLDSIVDYADSLNIGPGLEDPDIGPHVSQSELDSTLEYVDIGHSDGTTLETGRNALSGEGYEGGHFVEPAVFSGVESDMRIAQEEIFGPVLSVMRVRDFEEAIKVAKDVDYRLSVSIMTQDLSEAHEFVDTIEVGVAKVNEKTTGLEPHVPFGGYKDSSTNTYREQRGIDFFTSAKTVYLNY